MSRIPRIAGTVLVAVGLSLPTVVVASSPAPAQPTSPTADGQWIVYQGADGLRLVLPDGTGWHRLFAADGPPDPAHADWSPDGARLAFQAGTDGAWAIWTADADGSDAKVLVACQAPCISLDAPAWSPDGRSVAFSELDQIGDALPSKLQVIDVATGAITTVAETESGGYVTGPRWSPDGRSLAVAVEDHVAPDGSLVESPFSIKVAVLSLDDPTHTLRVVSGDQAFAGYPDWHPSQDLIVFQAGPRDPQVLSDVPPNLFTVHSDGSGLTQLTHFGATDPVVWLGAWTLDGSAILVTMTDRATGEHSLGRLLPDGTGLAPFPHPVGGAHARERRAPTTQP